MHIHKLLLHIFSACCIVSKVIVLVWCTALAVIMLATYIIFTKLTAILFTLSFLFKNLTFTVAMCCAGIISAILRICECAYK